MSVSFHLGTVSLLKYTLEVGITLNKTHNDGSKMDVPHAKYTHTHTQKDKMANYKKQFGCKITIFVMR